jgi:hypothetical protein
MSNSPEKISATALERVIECVRDVVMMRRRRGVKTEYALPEVAQIFDVTPKRAKSFFYRDGVWRIAVVEAQRIERRYLECLDHEIALSIEYTEALRVKRQQSSMRLQQCEDKNTSLRGSGFASIGSHARSAA